MTVKPEKAKGIDPQNIIKAFQKHVEKTQQAINELNLEPLLAFTNQYPDIKVEEIFDFSAIKEPVTPLLAQQIKTLKTETGIDLTAALGYTLTTKQFVVTISYDDRFDCESFSEVIARQMGYMEEGLTEYVVWDDFPESILKQLQIWEDWQNLNDNEALLSQSLRTQLAESMSLDVKEITS